MRKGKFSQTSMIESKRFDELLLLCEDQHLAQVLILVRLTQVLNYHCSPYLAMLVSKSKR